MSTRFDYKFDSLGAMLDFIQDRPLADPNYSGTELASRSEGRLKWSGSTFKGSIALARTGWADGLKKIQSCEDRINASLRAGSDMTQFIAESGDEVDVGLFLEGDPEHMIEYKLDENRKPVVKLVVSVSFSSDVSTDTVAMRGAAICAAIDACEASNLRVELWVDFHSTWRGSRASIRTKIKDANDSLDRDRVAFTLMHKSMTRQICLRFLETHRNTMDFVRNGYGYPGNPEEDDPDAVYIGAMHTEDTVWLSTSAAVAATKRLIEQLSAKAA